MEPTAWAEQAIQDYFEGGFSYREIAERYGRDYSTVAKVITRERGRRAAAGESTERAKTSRPDPRAHATMRRLSPTHARIGSRFNYYRTVQKNLSPTRMGDLLSVSRSVIGKMEAGAHDFTLTELWKIAQLLGITFEELLEEPKLMTPVAPAAAKKPGGRRPC